MAIARVEPDKVPSISDGAMTPSQMIAIAVQSGAEVDTLERLMGMSERWRAEEARRAFESAMADARSEFETIIKGNAVEHNGVLKYYHEDLSSVRRAVAPALAGNGLSYRWRTTQSRDGIVVTCVVSHELGHVEETTLGPVAPDASGGKNAVQAVGSTVTYLQRYTLKAALGLDAEHDDDGRGGPSQHRDRDAAAEQRAKRRADVEPKAKDFADKLIASFEGKTFDEATQMLRKEDEKWQWLLRNFPDIAQDVTDAAAELPLTIDNEQAVAPRFGRVNDEATNAS